MKTFRALELGSLLLVSACVAALGCSDSARPKEDVGSLQQHWWIVGAYDHGSNTGDMFPFLKPDVRRVLSVATEVVDTPLYEHEGIKIKEHSYFHFDNCRFEESTQLIRDHFAEIVNTLDDDTLPYAPMNNDWMIAGRNMGYIFHAVQDFYAHSNWVESGEVDLVDGGEFEWELLTPRRQVGANMMVIEDDLQDASDGLPPGATATLSKNDHVLEVFNSLNQPLRKGLITGTHGNADNFGQGACLRKAGLSMKHGDYVTCDEKDVQAACEEKDLLCTKPEPLEYLQDLIEKRTPIEKVAAILARIVIEGPAQANYMRMCGQIWRSTYLAKDQPPEIAPIGPTFAPKADNDKRAEWRKVANDLARQQTLHEFCRLGNLMERRYGEAGRKRLYDAWVDDPVAADNACGIRRFEEQTDEWRLQGVTGTRLSVADINDDEYADLVVREANDRETSFAAGGARRVRLLVNQGDGTFQDFTEESRLLTGPVRGTKNPVRSGRASQVIAFADIDNDGDVDAFSGSPVYKPKGLTSGELRPEILLNDGTGTFSTLATYPFGSTKLDPAGATFLDYDRDGRLDLLIPSRKQVGGVNAWLFRGTGSATAPFDSTPTTFGGAGRYTRSSLACDLNNDGRQELLLGAITRGANGLWQALGDRNYDDRSVASGYAYDLATGGNQDWKDNLGARAFCSYLRDGKVADKRYSKRSQCESAPGGCPSECTTFPCDAFRAPKAGETVASCDGVADFPADIAAMQYYYARRWNHLRDRGPARLGGNTFTSICADFNRDGRLDLFNAEHRESWEGQSADPSQVLKNISGHRDNVEFLRPGLSATGIELQHGNLPYAWTEGVQTAASFDFDNDGFPDLLLGAGEAPDNWGRLFRNDGGSQSSDIHFKSEYVAGLKRAQGIAVADFDRDGDLDFVTGSSNRWCDDDENCGSEQVRFFENQLQPKGNWIQIKLLGGGRGNGTANKSGIGARVAVELPGGECSPPAMRDCLVQEVDGGHGHFGAQHDRVLHFGLGPLGAATTVQVSVLWPRPDGEDNVQTWNVPPGFRYELAEGVAPPIQLPNP